MRAQTLIALGLTATAARAEHPLGTGRLGAVQVDAPAIINRYQPLTAPADAGGLALQVADAGAFASGELVLVLQMTGLSRAPDAGDGATVVLDGEPAGTYELVRVDRATGTTVSLLGPLQHTYGGVTQVISVPEYTTVNVSDGGQLGARKWDGATGGVLAFVATGALTNDGTIETDGVGFRGGTVVVDGQSMLGCTGLDEPAPKGGQKGEGVSDRFASDVTGRGNLAHAGGGGICDNAGGGGGGNAGRGGKGGRTYGPNDGSRDVGGLGGAPLQFDVTQRLVLGGGGGAGHSNGTVAGHGSAGGGIVFVRAASLSGSGRITANGARGSNAPNDGAGGGGAGGTLCIRVAGAVRCGQLSARGGGGGDQLAGGTTAHAPGGGGGGGRVLLQPASTDCPIDVANGVAGVTDDPNPPYGVHNGAEPVSSPDPLYSGRATQLTDPLPVPGTMPPPPEPVARVLAVGCGCQSTAGALWPVLLLATARWRRRARTRAAPRCTRRRR